MESIRREKLESGGELVINSTGGRIEYFFPGPDKRYGGVHVSIPEEKIREYMEAWQDNFARYEQLKKEKKCVEIGKMRMTIRTGMMDGVYLRAGHMRITRKSQLDQIVRDYEYALSCCEHDI